MSNESGTGVYVYQQIVKKTAEWETDKTVPVENVWLFERREDGKIVTKLSDGQHCYSDLPAYGLSAWQAAQMGGYKGTEEEFYESLGTFDEKIKWKALWRPCPANMLKPRRWIPPRRKTR